MKIKDADVQTTTSERRLAGIRAEDDASYHIDFFFGTESRKWMVIHDLRIVLPDGRTAQIDHLVISRWLDIWVCETKSFSGGVAINELGEWSRYANGRAQGIPSPIEQNLKHIDVLQSVFARGIVALPVRLGVTIQPRIRGLVLIANGASIRRPRNAKVKGLEMVIHTDQIGTKIDNGTIPDDKLSTFAKAMVQLGPKIVGEDTLEDFARRLAALHQPARPGHQPQAVSQAVGETASAPLPLVDCANCGEAVIPRVAAYCASFPERFGGLTLCRRCQTLPLPVPAAPGVPAGMVGEEVAADLVPQSATAVAATTSPAPKKTLQCAGCGIRITYTVAKWCWQREQRFGGSQYCMPCQATM